MCLPRFGGIWEGLVPIAIGFDGFGAGWRQFWVDFGLFWPILGHFLPFLAILAHFWPFLAIFARI